MKCSNVHHVYMYEEVMMQTNIHSTASHATGTHTLIGLFRVQSLLYGFRADEFLSEVFAEVCLSSVSAKVSTWK